MSCRDLLFKWLLCIGSLGCWVFVLGCGAVVAWLVAKICLFRCLHCDCEFGLVGRIDGSLFGSANFWFWVWGMRVVAWLLPVVLLDLVCCFSGWYLCVLVGYGCLVCCCVTGLKC